MQNKTEQLLKEKARMFSDRITEARLACKRFPNCEGCQTDCGAEFLVRLSDAEQEIDNWIDAYNKLNDSYQKEIKQVEAKLAKAILRYQDYDHERLELKQKLQALYERFLKLKNKAVFDHSRDASDYITVSDFTALTEEFEELLKEEKAKP